jgi:hypothetical protein
MAVTFISQEPCPEAGRKRALPSDKPGALSHENGFPLNNVRVRGQTDPYTQRKRDGAPLRIRDDGLVGAWLQLDPLERGTGPGGNHGEHCGLDREEPYLPTPTTWGPDGEGGALCHRRSTANCTVSWQNASAWAWYGCGRLAWVG